MTTKITHLVQVHPVSYGKVNRLQVMWSKKFKTKKEAVCFVRQNNMSVFNQHTLASYQGCVSADVGE